MITREDVAKYTMRRTMFLDGEDFYSNHAICTQNNRLMIVDTGPRGRGEGKHERKYYVDGIECPDLDAIVTMLNAEPVESKELSDARPAAEDGEREPGGSAV